MDWYATAKSVHVVCVALSITGFVTRFALAARGATVLDHPLARVLPHVNDTVLLGAAAGMLVVLRVNPFSVAWLSAKIAGLILYILLGMVALRRGRTARQRTAAFVTAVATFGYIVAVAIGKSVLGPFAWLGA
ncbi:MAG: SirB2 family protein [Burkholderiales bacterium]|nr:SirB2 family protein [Burkholderiales bacterium]